MMLLVIPQQDQGLLNGLIRPITKCKAMVVELASRDDPDKTKVANRAPEITRMYRALFRMQLW